MQGHISERLTGHAAEEWRLRNLERSQAEREEAVRDGVRERVGGAELTDIKLSDPADLTQPVAISYTIKAEGYATRTGKRLFVNPCYFKNNESARYTDESRIYDIYFHYPWSEIDDIRLDIPTGFELDHADAPGSLSFKPLGGYAVTIKTTKQFVFYHRELRVGDGGQIYLPKVDYKQVKAVFDAIHDRDGHLLTFKIQPAEAAASNPQTTP